MGVMFNQPGVTQHDWSGGGVNKEELDLLSMITRQNQCDTLGDTGNLRE